MSPDKEKELVSRYPDLFVYHGDKESRQPIGWGMTCSDGWFDLLDTLCADIQHLLKHRNERVGRPNGPASELFCRIVQVKEKFGGLRFYVSFEGDDSEEGRRTRTHLSGMIAFAESYSYKICEECGVKGTLREGGWHRTLCDSCEDLRKARYAGRSTEASCE